MHSRTCDERLAAHTPVGSGSMCCAWLLYSRECMDADDALTLFALERTDLRLGQCRAAVSMPTPTYPQPQF